MSGLYINVGEDDMPDLAVEVAAGVATQYLLTEETRQGRTVLSISSEDARTIALVFIARNLDTIARRLEDIAQTIHAKDH